MNKLMLSLLVVVGMSSCTKTTIEIPVVEKVKTSIMTNSRKYNMLANGEYYNISSFVEINEHNWNTESMYVSYTEGVNNNTMSEEMDSFHFNSDSTSVRFKKEYSNGVILNITYFSNDSVIEYRYFPQTNGFKKTTFWNK